MKPSYMISFVAIAVVCLIAACYEPAQGPIPEAPVPSAPRVPIPQKVIVEEELIYSPAPCNPLGPPHCEAGIGLGKCCPPDECNYIRFMRYRPETIDGSIKEVDAVVALMPGLIGGNSSLDYLGRQLVSMAEQAGSGSLEVWVMDRRPNCLEDLTGMNDAELAGDPSIALEYYFDVKNDGTVFNFLTDADVPYLSEFGMKLAIEDLHTVVTSMIPDEDDRRKTLFIGGHSLGGVSAGIYAAWDFDGDEYTDQDAGFKNCAGLISLDMEIHFPPDESHFFYDLIEQGFDVDDYEDRLGRMQNGQNLFYGSEVFNVAWLGVLTEVIAMYAAMAPDDEAEELMDIPGLGQNLTTKVFNSRDLSHFLTGIPLFTHFRFTNEAVLGVLVDDNFQPHSLLQVGLGFLHGGPVVEKLFPGAYAPLLETLVSKSFVAYIDKDDLFIPWHAGDSKLQLGTGPLYSWVDFDEVGNALDPDYQDTTGTLTYTNWREEMVDIQDFARSVYMGPSNSVEWYFSNRLYQDLQAVLNLGQEDLINHELYFLHGNRIDDFPPMIQFLASGISNQNNPRPQDVVIGPQDLYGYSHVDVVIAAVDRPTHRPNEVFEPLMNFVLDNSSGTVVPLD